MEFVSQNWIWIALAVVSAGLLVAPAFRAGGKHSLSTTQAVLLINRQDALVLDVRTAAEFAAGHVPDAKHLELAEIGARANEISKNKKRPILVVCQTGTRSGSAGEQLRKAGYEEVFSLEGGINSWGQAGQPLIKGA
jgi:rhodanese-related sulfurtransferase